MSESASGHQRNRRRRYIIDKKSQIGPTSQIVTVLIVVCVVFALGLLYFTRDNPLFEMETQEFRGFVMNVFALYLLVSVVVFSVMTISLTHRFVGPANVLQRAVEGIEDGEYKHRVSLRKKDHLKSLATAIDNLRQTLQERSEKRTKIVDVLERCLKENDVAAAKELVVQLKTVGPRESEEKPADKAASAAT